MPKCDRCPKHIVFVMVRSAGGKLSRMPVDEVPDPGGNVAVSPGHRARIVPKGGQLDDGEQLYMPHFATCANYRKPAAESRQPQPKPAPQPALFEE